MNVNAKEVRLGGKVLSAIALKDQIKIEVLSLPVRGLSAKPSIDGTVGRRLSPICEDLLIRNI